MLEETTLTTLRTLAARLNPASAAWRTQLTDEAAYWYARSAAERAPYTGQYVAVFKHTLIDHDPDRRALYLRVRQHWPNAPVLLIEAAAQHPPEFSVLSP